jgi:hypothetical protein
VFVRFIRRAQDAAGSQVVFVASSEMQHLPELLSALAGSPCLTVADDGTFLDRGGMLQFANGEQRERFEINVGRAERAGLKLSSKLLAIARVVE